MGNEEVDSREQILRATDTALVEYGYADLTMSDIADESGTSTSLLHYHFDTKADLLVAYLDDLVDRIEAELDAGADSDPITQLATVIDWYVLDDPDDDRVAFHAALLELRVQARYNDRFRERFARADRVIRDSLSELLLAGMDDGVFRPGDPDDIAALVIAALDGARNRQLSMGDRTYSRTVAQALHDHVLDGLLTPTGRDRWDSVVVERR